MLISTIHPRKFAVTKTRMHQHHGHFICTFTTRVEGTKLLFAGKTALLFVEKVKNSPPQWTQFF